jgi:hypothetical protein
MLFKALAASSSGINPVESMHDVEKEVLNVVFWDLDVKGTGCGLERGTVVFEKEVCAVDEEEMVVD